MSLGKVITLSDGSKVPQIGLGTWLSKPKEVENAVSDYIRLSYSIQASLLLSAL